MSGPVLSLTATALVAAGCSASTAHPTSGPTHRPASTTVHAAGAAPRTSPTPAAPGSTRPTTSTTPTPTPATSVPPGAEHTSVAPASPSAGALPVAAYTGDARQVITVVAPSRSSTTAMLQAWQRSAGGWRRNGPQIPANLGADGSTDHPSESLSATPVGSFTLTRAFGHDPNPGTALPYTHTTPQDWWISQAGPLYNTLQVCASSCPFTRGDPNEHLFYETPAYDYAVVIDYNTGNAPGGVRQGAGSAFFLHVSEGRPTAGCVSIPADSLIRLLRWLDPADHPRILIAS